MDEATSIIAHHMIGLLSKISDQLETIRCGLIDVESEIEKLRKNGAEE